MVEHADATGLVLGLAGIFAAGVAGPWVTRWWNARDQERQFRHDRGLKASDDLRDRLDDVGAGLELLDEAVAAARAVVFTAGAKREHVWEPLQGAEHAYQVARARIARLQMRPHASERAVDAARAASKAYLDAIRIVRAAMVAEDMMPADGALPREAVIKVWSEAQEGVGRLLAVTDEAVKLTAEYVEAACNALTPLIGTPEV